MNPKKTVITNSYRNFVHEEDEKEENWTKFVEVIIPFRVQFGINLNEWVFQKVSKFY